MSAVCGSEKIQGMAWFRRMLPTPSCDIICLLFLCTSVFVLAIELPLNKDSDTLSTEHQLQDKYVDTASLQNQKPVLANNSVNHEISRKDKNNDIRYSKSDQTDFPTREFGINSWTDKKSRAHGQSWWIGKQNNGSQTDIRFQNSVTNPLPEEETTDSRTNLRSKTDRKKNSSFPRGNLYEDYTDRWAEPSVGFLSEPACACEEKFLERVQDLERKVNDMFMDSDRLTTKMVETIDAVDKLLAAGRTGSGPQSAKQRQIVSFAVQASKNMPYLVESEVLKFDKVLVNNGGPYDPHSGIFFAPVDGVYLFSASILSGFNSTIETMITLNGHEVSRLYSGAFKNRGYGSNTVILNLRKGDEVAVAVFYGNGNYVHGKWSTFSGTLIETY